jgi:quercetin dioxygenase-like cupin family protein
MFKLVDWKSTKGELLGPSIERKFVSTENFTVAHFHLKKGVAVPTHQHPNEQVANVLQGALEFVLAGQTVTVSAGQSLCIPPDLPHSAEALEDTIAIDVFTPPRADWHDKKDDYLRGK